MVYEKDLVRALKLEVLLPAANCELAIEESDVNRPGLQLAGYWDYFAYMRPQLLGKGEMTYLSTLEPEVRLERIRRFFSFAMPCVIICRGMPCFPEIIDCAREKGIPVYRSQEDTVKMEMVILNFLNGYLAPRQTMHGVLVDVYGVGLLITGESGVGKSEAALELVKRGHQLVADDVVEIKRVSDKRLVGEAPEIVRHFMEIRGIGIIDIATMYGIGAVINNKSIDMEVHLELWKPGAEYDRLGLVDEYSTILGVQLPRIVIPVRPGRNLAIVLEVAARNLRLKQMGYNAAQEIDKRATERMLNNAED